MVFSIFKRGKKKPQAEQEVVVEETRAEEEKSASLPVFKEVYPLIEPYAYAAIATDPSTGQLRYHVIEPTLSEEEKELLERIEDLLLQELDINLRELHTREDAEEYLKEKIEDIVKRYKIGIEEEALGKLEYYITRDFIYLGKIEPMMRDHMIEDISCDGVGIPIYVWHREYESMPTNVKFDTAEELDRFIIRLAYLAGKHISYAQPLVDAGLPDGSRVQLTLGSDIARRGSTFTIRKFRADPLTIVDLIMFNTLSAEMAAYFWFLIENKTSIMVAGGIGCGKTTLLNCLSMFIRPEMKIVSIEDTPELNLPHENWIPSVVRTGFGGSEEGEIDMFDLLKAAVRQRPDYIIVGEVRGREAYVLFQATATGHLGMCTIHAESVSAVIHRLEAPPMNVPRMLITAMNVVTVQATVKVHDRPARRTVQVTELVGLDPGTNEIITNEVFRWNPKQDTFEYSGRSYMLDRIRERKGYSPEYVKEELEHRKVILEWMVKNNIRRYKEVAKIIREYYSNPKKLYEQARLGLPP